jgi:predicted cobalt transporter CbtA
MSCFRFLENIDTNLSILSSGQVQGVIIMASMQIEQAITWGLPTLFQIICLNQYMGLPIELPLQSY